MDINFEDARRKSKKGKNSGFSVSGATKSGDPLKGKGTAPDKMSLKGGGTQKSYHPTGYHKSK